MKDARIQEVADQIDKRPYELQNCYQKEIRLRRRVEMSPWQFDNGSRRYQGGRWTCPKANFQFKMNNELYMPKSLEHCVNGMCKADNSECLYVGSDDSWEKIHAQLVL